MQLSHLEQITGCPCTNNPMFFFCLLLIVYKLGLLNPNKGQHLAEKVTQHTKAQPSVLPMCELMQAWTLNPYPYVRFLIYWVVGVEVDHFRCPVHGCCVLVDLQALGREEQPYRSVVTSLANSFLVSCNDTHSWVSHQTWLHLALSNSLSGVKKKED